MANGGSGNCSRTFDPGGGQDHRGRFGGRAVPADVHQAEVRWSRDGQRFVHSADEPTRFVRELFRQYGESVGDLEVRRASLEDTYMALVRQAESGESGGSGSGPGSDAIRKFSVVAG